ncbi:MAG: ABC transporter permease, partial [Salinivenus sp.]
MRLADLLTLAWANLWRNRTRSLLTGVGVMVGTAALVMLLAYGSGLEQTADREFNALRLDNTLRVTSHPIPGMTGARSAIQPDSVRRPQQRVPLTDSLVRRMAQVDGVLAAYPEMQFPAKLQGNGRTLAVTAEGIPMDFRQMATYRPTDGRFFASGGDPAVL